MTSRWPNGPVHFTSGRYSGFFGGNPLLMPVDEPAIGMWPASSHMLVKTHLEIWPLFNSVGFPQWRSSKGNIVGRWYTDEERESLRASHWEKHNQQMPTSP